MVPEQVKEFLRHPLSMTLASRDDMLRPIQTRVFGAKVHDDQQTVTCYIAECHSKTMVSNFENNGRVAFTVASPADNDSYQLKGSFISWRKNNPDDDIFLDEYQTIAQEFYKELGRQLGYTEDMIATFNILVYKPTAAITFKVEDVFGQAPHPETGNRIS